MVSQKGQRHTDPLFGKILDSATLYSFVLITMKGTIQSWNTGAENVFGWTREEVIGVPVGVTFIQDDTGDAARIQRERSRQVMRHGRAIFTMMRCRKNGQEFPLHCTVTALKNDAGQIDGFLEIGRDVSEEFEKDRRLEVQAGALAQAKGFLEGLLHALPAGVLTIDSRGVVKGANPAAEAILGYAPGTLEETGAIEAGVPARMRLDQSEFQNFEETLVNNQGFKRTLLWSWAKVRGSGTDPADTFAASFIDITDKQDLESKFLQGKQEIEAVFDSMTDPTFVVDGDFRVIRANHSLASFLGRSFQEILGRRCSDVMRERCCGCRTCPAEKVFHSGESINVEWRDKETICKIYCYPIFKRGRVAKVVLRVQDVTTERKMERLLLQSEKMASIGQLSAGVAHEINNPVAYIISNLNRLAEFQEQLAGFATTARNLAGSVLAGKADPLQAWREYLGIRDEADLEFLQTDMKEIIGECQEGADRIRRIVLDLKTFSHPHDGEWEYSDLNQGLQSTLNIVWNELKYKCEVVRDFGNLPQVPCDLQQLNQVFMNLLVNAAQAVPERGVITVTTRAQWDRVSISVADTGVGIPPENLNRIFDPFFTTKPVGKGTGLGLHIAFGIVQKHGGEILAESEVGRGSTFTVLLPMVPPKAAREDQ